MEAFAETVADALASQSAKLLEIGKHEELFRVEEVAHTEESNEDHNHEDNDPHSSTHYA